MKFIKLFLLYVILNSTVQCQRSENETGILFGADVLVRDSLEFLQNKKVGLIINHSSFLRNNTPLLDTLISLGIEVTTIFSPEHGFKGQYSAGEFVNDSVDQKTQIIIYSLYGREKKPTPEMLKEVDVLIFDIQDIGARFYTYISTLYYIVEAAAENKIDLIVLDRPNPLGGLKTEGPVLETDFKSFIGISEIPVVHGMTIGELAKLFEAETNTSDKEINLLIIEMENWKRESLWHQLNREWAPTSPNIPDFETAIIYPGTCLLEGTNVSEGRGTDSPFKIIGSPFINSEVVINELKKLNISGAKFTPVTFIPEDIPGKTFNPKFENENCNGIEIQITDIEIFMPFEFGIKLVYILHKLYPKEFQFKNDHIDKLIGNDFVRKMISDGTHPDSIINSWQNDLNQFKEKRKQYLLY